MTQVSHNHQMRPLRMLLENVTISLDCEHVEWILDLVLPPFAMQQRIMKFPEDLATESIKERANEPEKSIDRVAMSYVDDRHPLTYQSLVARHIHPDGPCLLKAVVMIEVR